MKQTISLLSGALLGLAGLTAAGAALAPSTPLIVDGPIIVDAADFEGNMMRIPENRRAEFRTSYDRVATVVDNIFIARTFATRAREMRLDQDPAVQRRLQQLQEGLLSELYVQKVVTSEVAKLDLEERAREVFKADRSRMTKPEQVYVQQILIGLKGRNREAAAELAKRVRSEALAPGADFLALADKYSEDPDKGANGGDLGYRPPTSFVEPVREAISKMTAKGQVSQPVESEHGFLVVRFIDRKPPQPVTFEEVRKRLVETEREKLVKQRIDALVEGVRGSKTVVVHKDNVEALVTPIDPEELKRAVDAASAAPKK